MEKPKQFLDIKIDNGFITEVEGLKPNEFLDKSFSDYKEKTIKLLEISEQDFFNKEFEIGLKILELNHNKESLNLKDNIEFWHWLKMNIGAICYEFLLIENIETFTLKQKHFLFYVGINETFIKDTINDNLLELIQKSKDANIRIFDKLE